MEFTDDDFDLRDDLFFTVLGAAHVDSLKLLIALDHIAVVDNNTIDGQNVVVQVFDMRAMKTFRSVGFVYVDRVKFVFEGASPSIPDQIVSSTASRVLRVSGVLDYYPNELTKELFEHICAIEHMEVLPKHSQDGYGYRTLVVHFQTNDDATKFLNEHIYLSQHKIRCEFVEETDVCSESEA